MQSSSQLTTTDDHQVPPSFSVCGRPTKVGTPKDLALLQNFNDKDGAGNNCPGANSNDVLIIQGLSTFGRTGNNLIEFLHSLQYGRDHDVKVGVKYDSWVIPMIQDMWMSRDVGESVTDWEARFEKAFCVKIFHHLDEWEGYNIVGKEWGSIDDSHTFTRELFMYTSEAPLHDYVGHQAQHLQALFRYANTGQGLNLLGQPVQDMCSGLKAVFGTNTKSSVIYTAIHQRHLEGAPGKRLLWKVAQKSGCDSTAALNMEPEYVKSILRPIGMLHHHIVLIADGEDPAVIERLKADPEIGKKLRVVPPEASWVGGDITLAIMANVFIGNPASSFSGFIAKSRVALGLGHNYLFRAKSVDGKWYTSCGGTCIFDHNIMGVMI